MNFDVSPAFDIPRRKNHMVDNSAPAKKAFWETVEQKCPGLPDACGCYVFTIQAAKGFRPWYVGLAEKRSFRKECFGHHKVILYSQITVGRKGTPKLIFLPRLTPSERFSRPSKNGRRDIQFLENALIGLSLARNHKLLNIRGTILLRNMVVPGVINSPVGKPKKAITILRKVLYR